MKFKAFCIIPHPGEIEIKPLVLCRECCHYIEETGTRFCELTGWWHDGEWYCADGEKNGEKGKTRRYYTQDGTISWEGEEDG